jgi:predicted PurR-regulated permease PerM
VGLAIVFGATGHPVLAGFAIGVLTGWLNVVPYFGPLLGMFLAVSNVLLAWSGIGGLVGVVVVFLAVQQIEAYVLTPRLLGDRVGLPPVVVILALLLGGQLLGLVGLLLALPAAGVMRVWLPDLLEMWRSSRTYTGELRR